ncbi:hypothetical protein CYMTET_17736 [Cymbomonas tetramitiformis]|uniref:Uncharacterized protein n=1 Tax=Cymbomonas tetramitiformis TaxID=36881 RepID=A0AAE0L6M7_9CHLO|nr:hypothetical protein CYMTET_17736 [Cymbomonas tetramitiformis]
MQTPSVSMIVPCGDRPKKASTLHTGHACALPHQVAAAPFLPLPVANRRGKPALAKGVDRADSGLATTTAPATTRCEPEREAWRDGQKGIRPAEYRTEAEGEGGVAEPLTVVEVADHATASVEG